MEILIVDDEPQVAEVLARSLAREGHSAKIANSGEEALRLLARSEPDARNRLTSRAGSSHSPCLPPSTRPRYGSMISTNAWRNSTRRSPDRRRRDRRRRMEPIHRPLGTVRLAAAPPARAPAADRVPVCSLRPWVEPSSFQPAERSIGTTVATRLTWRSRRATSRRRCAASSASAASVPARKTSSDRC